MALQAVYMSTGCARHLCRSLHSILALAEHVPLHIMQAEVMYHVMGFILGVCDEVAFFNFSAKSWNLHEITS